MKRLTTILIPTAQLLVALSLPASAASLELSNDSASAGPGQFAAEEIRREAAARGMTMVHADGKSPADAIQVKLTVERAGDAVEQSYRIRVVNDGGRRVITVRGADPAGAMYGGLDIAEAIRTGTLDALKDSDHQPHIARRGIKFNIPARSAHAQLHRLLRRRAGEHSRRCGSVSSGLSSSTRWRGTATTCFRSGASIPSLRW